MNALVGYSSNSDSDSDSDPDSDTYKDTEIQHQPKQDFINKLPKTLSKPNLPTFTPPPASKPKVQNPKNVPRVLGKSIKNTFNSESIIKSSIIFPESNIKSTDLLIPTQYLIKKKHAISNNESQEAKNIAIEKSKAQPFGLDLFGINTPRLEKRKLETTEDEIELGEFDALGGFSVKDRDQDKQEVDEESRKFQASLGTEPKKRKRNEIDESKIQDVRMDEFYKQNNKMIEQGELDAHEHILKHSKIRYYQQGNNNLSDIIKFTEFNKDKLTRKVGIEKAKEKDRGKQYGFK